MLSKYKNYPQRQLAFLGRRLGWIHPNTLTIIGIIPYALFLFFMNRHDLGLGLLCLAFAPLDLLDGLVARQNGKVTAFGGFLDSTLDRVADFLLIAGLYAAGLAPLPLLAALLLCSFLISYARARAELAGLGRFQLNVGWMERTERILLMALAVAAAILFPHARIFGLSLAAAIIWILTILSAWTVWQRIRRAYALLG